MSKQYTTIIGDTFEIISRKQYGSEENANKIAKANPGVKEPLVENLLIIIPDLPQTPDDKLQNTNFSNVNEVSLLIDNKRFRFWTNIRITRAIDNMDTVEFSAPFNSDIKEFREMFRPFSYKSIIVNVGGEVLFTGVMIGVNPVLESSEKTISISCYSLPGVLNDCTLPASSFSTLEFNGVNLKDIATTLIEPFGLGIKFTADPGVIFDRVALNEGENVISFLAGLAKQRNLIISSTQRGEVLFQQSLNGGKLVARLFQGESPLLSITPLFNSQEYYSHITGVDPVAVGSNGSQFTVKNSRLSGVIRPNTFNVPDTATADVKTAVQSKMGRMFANVVSYSIAVSTWRDSNGDLWAPNTLVILHAHDAMIYTNYAFIVRNVDFKRDQSSELAILNLVIPGSFEGKTPDSLPWDG